jgi:MFS family permease
VNAIGNGMFLTTSVLFLVRIVGLHPGQLSAALALAGACGAAAGIPVGQLADRWGSRRMAVSMLFLEGVLSLGYLGVKSMLPVTLLLCVTTFLDRGANTARSTLIAHVLSPKERVRGRAVLRAVQNVGTGAGAAASTLAIQADTRAAYLTVIMINALSFVITALLLLGVSQPRTGGAASPPASRADRHRVFRDLPYMSIAGLNAVLMFQVGVISTGLPLWIVGSTRAPSWMVSAAVVLNTVLVIALQVPLSRRAEGPAGAARACAWSGLLLGGACVVLGSAGSRHALLATALVLVAVVLLTVGEVLSSAGGWGLSYDLAAPEAHGAYQGVFTTGAALGALLSPVVVVNTGIQFGLPGWIALGAAFAGAGALMPPARRWAAARHAVAEPAGT